ncbi:catalase family peroxidase [Kutzneria kofuensis]|uniref:Catalase n=1 Tax=Kutzneria kofuensis TaxID=103725 RepID=A0A7W9NFI7_9PSEU|nr:catalase family peroxidase [Kutzneria kofuensis]MBB5890048.1 catalase [Kutzneria kofuensis]
MTVVDAMERMSGLHPGFRRTHALGRCYDAVFTPSGAAAAYTTAAHLRSEPTPAIVRYSNTAGDPAEPDGGTPVVRGMAVKFLSPETDLVSLNVPVFMASTPAKFLDMTRALTDQPKGSRQRADAVIAFITANPESAHAFQEAATIPVPESYATIRFWAQHAFVWVGPDGTCRFVRYRWEPDAGLRHLRAEDTADWVPGHLLDELTDRLGRAPVSFTLKVQFAGPEDPTADPTQPWPDDRPEIDAGRLEIVKPVADQEFWDRTVFDPTRLTDGIELSDDPVLAYRKQAYAEGHRRRAAGR